MSKVARPSELDVAIRLMTRNHGRYNYALEILHRSADLCDGAVGRHHADRRHRAVVSADRAVSAHHAAVGQRVDHLSRCQHQVVADTVAAPIEQQVTGVPGMLYMSSQMGNDGTYSLSVTFDVDVDLNTALVMVQNRVALAMPHLPTQVQNQGITIRKKTPDILSWSTSSRPCDFTTSDGKSVRGFIRRRTTAITLHRRKIMHGKRHQVAKADVTSIGQPIYDDIDLSNFALINVKDEILRVDGVSDISIMGERDYSIRVWLDPQKLASRNMTAIDVANAIRDQNQPAAAGTVGQPPMPRGPIAFNCRSTLWAGSPNRSNSRTSSSRRRPSQPPTAVSGTMSRLTRERHRNRHDAATQRP